MVWNTLLCLVSLGQPTWLCSLLTSEEKLTLAEPRTFLKHGENVQSAQLNSLASQEGTQLTVLEKIDSTFM